MSPKRAPVHQKYVIFGDTDKAPTYRNHSNLPNPNLLATVVVQVYPAVSHPGICCTLIDSEAAPWQQDAHCNWMRKSHKALTSFASLNYPAWSSWGPRIAGFHASLGNAMSATIVRWCHAVIERFASLVWWPSINRVQTLLQTLLP